VEPQPEPLPVRLLVIETLISGIVIGGPVPPSLPEPADPIIGLTTTEDGNW
jgi:hypothetical protein